MAARLSFDERCVISAMVGVGASAGQIADELGRHFVDGAAGDQPCGRQGGLPSRGCSNRGRGSGKAS